MNTSTSPTAHTTLQRKPAPPIARKRSQPRRGAAGPPAGPSDRSQRAGDHALELETIDLDVPAVAAALSRRLYAAGVPVAPERAVTLAQALTLVSPLSPSTLYWTARAVFVSAPAQLSMFDAVFASVFGGCPDSGAQEA